MTDNARKLIEEGSTPSGPGDFASAENEADYWRHYAMRLRAALEASLPTEYDREAVARALCDADEPTIGSSEDGDRWLPDEVEDPISDGEEWRLYLPMADRFLAGFRRSPVPPETDEEYPTVDPLHRAHASDTPWMAFRAGYRVGWNDRASGRDWRKYEANPYPEFVIVPPVTEERNDG